MASLLLPGSRSAGRVMLYDLNVYKPPAEFKVDQSAVIQMWRETQRYSPEEIDFQERVYVKSGLAAVGTHLPPNLNPAFVGNDAATDLNAAAAECRMAVCGAVEGLFEKTGLRPKDIDILVTTCSIYCPTPSMASMVVNAFGLRKDIQAYHLGGMGCANGVVGINLVADLLKAHPNSTALFICTETTTPAYYRGNDRHRLVTNLLFRMGAAAVALTNRPSLRARAKYVLQHRVRVHTGQSDEAISAIHYGPDAVGHNGIYLGKNVVSQASRALGLAMTQVAPHILTWTQLAAAALHMLQQQQHRRRNRQHHHATSRSSSSVGAPSAVAPTAAAPAAGKESPPAPTATAPAVAAAAVAGVAAPSARRAPSDSGNGSSCGSRSSSSSSGGGGSSDDDDRHRSSSSSGGGGSPSGKAAPQPCPSGERPASPGATAPTAKVVVAQPHTPAPPPSHTHLPGDAPAQPPASPQPQHHPHAKQHQAAAGGSSSSSSSGSGQGQGQGQGQYRPNFQHSTCRHFLLHAGGAKVLDGLGEALQLDGSRLAPSRAVLHDYGNVSSSTTWYTLAHVESLGGVRRGERVLQVGVGSGIKCGVNVWKALRDVREVHPAWEHRLAPAEAAALRLAASVDLRGLGSRHVAGRALFALVMVAAAALMHLVMLRLAAAGLAAA